MPFSSVLYLSFPSPLSLSSLGLVSSLQACLSLLLEEQLGTELGLELGPVLELVLAISDHLVPREFSSPCSP
tara:strand:- start:409 stop:624 length:216 start_codon:yes stop_codon:yes gene_type:complete